MSYLVTIDYTKLWNNLLQTSWQIGEQTSWTATSKNCSDVIYTSFRRAPGGATFLYMHATVSYTHLTLPTIYSV